MGRRSLIADENLREKLHARPYSVAGSLLRYELNVIADDVANVVASIGGWLFDRSAAGWDVTVLLLGDQDRHALRILGVGGLELDPWLSGAGRGTQRGAGLAVASELRGTDERIEAEIGYALRSGDIEVVQWGRAGVTNRRGAIEYRLSAAARIFKGHALAATCLTDAPVGATETLWRTDSSG